MKHLFSPEGALAIAGVMARRPLLAFDFDGTLAAIVARPDEARVTGAVARRLEQLGRVLPLAIISGRSVEDVRERLNFAPDFIIGSHGAEDPSSDLPFDSAPVLDVVREHVDRHAAELEASGVSLEDKLHSMALHYRLARDRPAALDLISRVVSGLSPDVRVFGGKMVVNIVAVRAPDKGDAVMDLMARCGTDCAVFAGDDLNDEPVFKRADGSWLTVKVGRDDPGTRAMFVLDSFGEVATMLDRMIAALGSSKAYNGS